MGQMLREKRVKARKPHRCDYCGKPILPGEEYSYSVHVDDCLYDWHACDRCRNFVRTCYDQDYCGCKWEGLDAETLDYFMREHHPGIRAEWKRDAERQIEGLM